MIKPENISAKAIRLYNDMLEEELSKIGVKTFQDILDARESHPEFHWSESENMIERYIRSINLRNRVEREPDIYIPREYKKKGLKINDELNYGQDLIISTPTAYFSSKRLGVKDRTIADIKEDISLTNYKGDNFLIYRINEAGEEFKPVIQNAIELFTDQVERQAKTAPSTVQNVFAYNYDSKAEIIEKKYAEIVAYLIHYGNDTGLIWGDLTQHQKELLLLSVISNADHNTRTKQRLMRIITNYVTEEEAVNIEENNYRPLRRFIRK